MNGQRWSREMDYQLLGLSERGLSCRAIAEAMGLTRNQVIGRLWRLKPKAERGKCGRTGRPMVPVPQNADPAVRQAVDLVIAGGTTWKEACIKAGLSHNIICGWRRGSTPTVANVRALLNAVGYDLAVVPKG